MQFKSCQILSRHLNYLVGVKVSLCVSCLFILVTFVSSHFRSHVLSSFQFVWLTGLNVLHLRLVPVPDVFPFSSTPDSLGWFFLTSFFLWPVLVFWPSFKPTVFAVFACVTDYLSADRAWLNQSNFLPEALRLWV